MGYKLYRKYRTDKKWKIIKIYKTKGAAERHAQGIRDANPNYYAMIRKVKEKGSDIRQRGDRF